MSPSLAITKQVSVSQIDYYETHSEEYFRATVGLDMSSIYKRFLGELTPGAHILDAGCGSGRYTKAFLEMGIFCDFL